MGENLSREEKFERVKAFYRSYEFKEIPANLDFFYNEMLKLESSLKEYYDKHPFAARALERLSGQELSVLKRKFTD